MLAALSLALGLAVLGRPTSGGTHGNIKLVGLRLEQPTRKGPPTRVGYEGPGGDGTHWVVDGGARVRVRFADTRRLHDACVEVTVFCAPGPGARPRDCALETFY